MSRLVTLDVIKIKDWYVKASVFDDQILIFFINYNKMTSYCRAFYDEDCAYNYIEKLRGDL